MTISIKRFATLGPEIAARMLGENADATQLLPAGIELAISELVMRSDPEAR